MHVRPSFAWIRQPRPSSSSDMKDLHMRASIPYVSMLSILIDWIFFWAKCPTRCFPPAKIPVKNPSQSTSALPGKLFSNALCNGHFQYYHSKQGEKGLFITSVFVRCWYDAEEDKNLKLVANSCIASRWKDRTQAPELSLAVLAYFFMFMVWITFDTLVKKRQSSGRVKRWPGCQRWLQLSCLMTNSSSVQSCPVYGSF